VSLELVIQEQFVQVQQAPAPEVVVSEPSFTTVEVSSGIIGPRGPEGASAYEIAVAGGFVGTEQEWLDSLNAPPTTYESDGVEVGSFDRVNFVDGEVTESPSGTLRVVLASSKAAALVVERIAGEDVTEGELVCASTATPGEVLLADANTDADLATVFGIALQSQTTGQPVNVLISGVYSDPAFSVFPVNAQLFLDLTGAVTDDRPTGPARKYLTGVGKSLGGGEIFVSVSTPIVLGA